MKYNDEKFDYDLNFFNKKTIAFLKYAWKDSNHSLVISGG